MTDLVSGDDIAIEATLTKNDVVFAIDSGATVQASLVTLDKAVILVAPVAVLEATAGSDWANSKVVVSFADTLTENLTVFGNMYLEIQVDDGGKLTWFESVTMVQGTIDQ